MDALLITILIAIVVVWISVLLLRWALGTDKLIASAVKQTELLEEISMKLDRQQQRPVLRSNSAQTESSTFEPRAPMQQ